MNVLQVMLLLVPLLWRAAAAARLLDGVELLEKRNQLPSWQLDATLRSVLPAGLR